MVSLMGTSHVVSRMRLRIDQGFSPPEELLYSAPGIRVGRFRCPIAHPEFRHAGQIEGYTVVFPRTSVWIEQDGRAPFVADPHVMVLYNLGQPYTRRPLAEDGDRADWFSVGPALAATIANDVQPDGDPLRPFNAGYIPTPSALFYRQRRTLARILRGEADALFVEQEVVGVIGTAMERAPLRTTRVRHDARGVVEATRAEICRDPSRAFTVRELARCVSVSPFHLCRLFRRETGVTLHEYLVDLRLRRSLEWLSEGESDLSRVAFEVGFSSHSHFSAAFRRRLGVSPSCARKELTSLRAALSNPVTAAHVA